MESMGYGREIEATKRKENKKDEKRELSLNIYLIIRFGDLEGSPMARGCDSDRVVERKRVRRERIKDTGIIDCRGYVHICKYIYPGSTGPES